MLGQISQQNELSQARAVFEWSGSIGTAGADGLNEVFSTKGSGVRSRQ